MSDEVKFEFLEESLFIVGYIVSYVRITERILRISDWSWVKLEMFDMLLFFLL